MDIIKREDWEKKHAADMANEALNPRVVEYSKYKIQLACQKRELWEQVKAAIAASGKQDSWDNIIDIASDNPELLAVLPAIKETFGEEVVEAVLQESIME